MQRFIFEFSDDIMVDDILGTMEDAIEGNYAVAFSVYELINASELQVSKMYESEVLEI